MFDKCPAGYPEYLGLTGYEMKGAETVRVGFATHLSPWDRLPELAAARFILNHPDYVEGVRARLVDKDDNPRWQPKTIEAVKDPDLKL
jgi:enoyl-CoA hydratase/carnithine racemase